MAPAQNTTGWILSVAARSKCPRCGQGRLFNGFLTYAKTCDVCGLDYSFADTADGPAFFAMMGMGVPVTAFGIWIELAFACIRASTLGSQGVRDCTARG